MNFPGVRVDNGSRLEGFWAGRCLNWGDLNIRGSELWGSESWGVCIGGLNREGSELRVSESGGVWIRRGVNWGTRIFPRRNFPRRTSSCRNFPRPGFSPPDFSPPGLFPAYREIDNLFFKCIFPNAYGYMNIYYRL